MSGLTASDLGCAFMNIAIAELTSQLRKVLSLLWLRGPDRITNLRNALAHCATDLPKGYTSTRDLFKADLETLSSMGWVATQGRESALDWGISGNPDFAEQQKLVSCEEFLSVLECVRRENPVNDESRRYHYYGSGRFTQAREREMLLAVLNGDREAYSGVLALWSNSMDEKSAAAIANAWRRLLGDGRECPAALSDDLIPEALEQVLPQLCYAGIPATSWLERLERLPDSAFAGNLFALSAVASQFVWMGDRSGLEKLGRFAAAGDDAGAVRLLAGCRAFLDGQWQEAEKQLQRALSGLRKQCDDSRLFWNNPTGLAYLFAAIKTPIGKNKIDQATNQYYDALNKRGISCARFMTQALALLDHLANRNAVPDREWFCDWGAIDLYAALPISQCFFHIDPRMVDKKAVECILQCARKVAGAGYRLAAVYLFGAVKQAGALKSAEANELSNTLAETGLVPLWKAVSRDDLWQVALDELEKFAPDPEKKSVAAFAGPSEEVCWYVSLRKESGFYEAGGIEPRLRKRRPDGSWTAGRRIALDKLMAGVYDAALDPGELKVKSHIRGYDGWGNHYGYIESNALIGLVENPRVFQEEKGISHPIRIVAGECALRVEKTSAGHSLSFPFPAEVLDKGMVLQRESPDVYRLYQFSDQLRQMGAVLAKYGEGRLLVPSRGEKRFKEVMTRLIGTVRVAGDLDVSGVEGVREVEGGVELHWRIFPAGNGLTMELLNRPLREFPHMVAPGVGAARTFVDSDGEKLLITRNLEQETLRRNELVSACPSLSDWKTAANRWEIGELESALKALGELNDAPRPAVLEWPRGQDFKVSRPVDFGDFEFSMGFTSADWLTVGGEVKVDEGEVARLSAILEKLPEAIGDFVPLDERNYLRLTTKMRRQLGELSGALLPGKGDTLTASAAALPLLMETIPEDLQAGFGKLWKQRTDALRRALEIEPSEPRGLQGELRPYQKEGFVWLSRLYEWGGGACLADDMGLGKTIQILTLLLDRAAAGPSLVIAPASVCRNWQREAARFTPGLKVRILGNADRAGEIDTLRDYDVLICSYGILVSEEALLTGKKWNCVVLDEAQAIKNHQSKRACAAKRLKTGFRLASTGTPLENNLDELWSLFDFLNPGLLGSHTQFSRKFLSAASSTHALKKLVGPFLLRRLKSQVLDELPPKTEVTLEVTLPERERNFYESLRREALQALSADAGNTHVSILAQLTKLRRACCHPMLVAPQLDFSGAKMELLMELVGGLRAGGHRALIFSQYVDCLSIVRRMFGEAGIASQYLDGSTPTAERMDRVDAFQRGEGDFFLISLKAGGTGLNLTAANYVIILDPWWNPAVENQAADRAHRIGQNQPVTVYRLVTADTVEEKVIELHARKREMAEEILAGAEKTRLSKDDLMALFR